MEFIGKLGFFRLVDEEIQHRIFRMIDSGGAIEEARNLVNKHVDRSGNGLAGQITPTNAAIERVREKRSVLSRIMNEEVTTRLDNLTAKMDEIPEKQ